MQVARSTFYAWQQRQNRPVDEQEQQLVQLIRLIHAKSHKSAGSRTIKHVLSKQYGIGISRSRVQRLMRQIGISGTVYKSHRRKMAVTAQQADEQNVLARDFTPGAPDQRWCADIKQVKTKQGWLYLAIVLDIGSRRVIGWSMSDSATERLVSKAFEMAYKQRQPKVGWIYHSDRGSQYTSTAHQEKLRVCGARISLSRVGNCWDNAVCESFFASVEKQWIKDLAETSMEETRHQMVQYIVWYNAQRPHSTLGYISPKQFEDQFYDGLLSPLAA